MLPMFMFDDLIHYIEDVGYEAILVTGDNQVWIGNVFMMVKVSEYNEKINLERMLNDNFTVKEISKEKFDNMILSREPKAEEAKEVTFKDVYLEPDKQLFMCGDQAGICDPRMLFMLDGKMEYYAADPKQPVFFYKGGEVVGVFMPQNNEWMPDEPPIEAKLKQQRYEINQVLEVIDHDNS